MAEKANGTMAQFWINQVGKYGLGTVLSIVLIYYVVIPLRDGHLMFLEKQVDASATMADTLGKQTTLIQSMNSLQQQQLTEQREATEALGRIEDAVRASH